MAEFVTGALSVCAGAGTVVTWKRAAFRAPLLYPALARLQTPLLKTRFKTRAPPLQFLLLLLTTAAPMGLLAGTAAETYANESHLAGVGAALIGLAVFSLVLAGATTVAARYALTVQAIACIVVGLAALLAHLIVFLTMTDPFTFIGTCAIFVIASAVPAFAVAYRRSSERGVSLRRLLREEHESTTTSAVRRRADAALYALSTLLLVVNAAVIYGRADRGRGLGVAVMAACVVMDAVVLLHAQTHSLPPTVACLALLAGRVATFGMGDERFFIGHAILVFLAGLALTCYWRAAGRESAAEQTVRNLLGAAKSKADVRARVPLLLLLSAFALETAIVAAEPASLIVPRIDGQPQALYGVLSLLLLAATGSALVAVEHFVDARAALRAAGKPYSISFVPIPVRLLGASYACLCGAGVLAAVLWSEIIVLLALVALPVCSSCAWRGYHQWALGDFHLNLGRLVKEKSRWQRLHPVLKWWGVAVFVLYAVGAVATAVDDSAWVSWTVVATVNTSAAILLARARYYHRQSLGRFGLGVAVYSGLSLVLWASLVGAASGLGTECLLAAVVYAAIWGLALSLDQHRDKNPHARRGFVAVAVLTVAADILVAVQWESAGLGVTVLLLQLSLLSLLRLKKHRRQLLGAQLGALVLAGLVAAIAWDRVFAGYSVSWLAMAAVLALLAVQAPPRLVPVYVLQPESGRLEEDNTSAMAAMGALVMLVVWGLAASVLLDRSYFGMLTATVATALLLLYVLAAKHRTGMELARALAATDPDVRLRTYGDALRELLDHEPTTVASEESRATAGEVDAQIKQAVALARALEQQLEKRIVELCQGQYSPNPLRSMVAMARGRWSKVTREELASLLDDHRRVVNARERAQRFRAAVQLFAAAHGSAHERTQTAELVAFLREKGVTDVSAARIDDLPPELRAQLEDKWREYQDRRRAEVAERERLREQERLAAEERERKLEERLRQMEEAAKRREEEEKGEEKGGEEEEKRTDLGLDGVVHFETGPDGKFSDADFPREVALAGCARDYEWERVPGPELFAADAADPNAIKQGHLGDCWYLSAVATAATRAGLLERLFVHSDPERGFYAVQFWKNGAWRQVVVDDFFPTRGRGRLAFARSVNDHETWVQVLEKAYAKLHGSYEALDGGQVHYALVDLTAGGSDGIDLTGREAVRDIATGALWQRLLHYHRLGYLLGAASPSGSDSDVSPLGIVQGHAYSVLRVEELDGAQLVQLRNPWGNTEWKGAWSDGSHEWNARRRAKLGQEDRDDGAFWMAFEDVTMHFDQLYICRLFNDSWARACVSGKWDGPTAGGCSNHESVKRNPQWALSGVTEETEALYLILTQRDNSGRRSNFAIGFTLFDLRGARLASRGSKRTIVAETPSHKFAREVSLELRLLPRPKPYTLVPSTFNPGEETSFTITVFSKGSAVQLTPLLA